jgi:uncharacterized membrane protein YhaH (DUF805 family)
MNRVLSAVKLGLVGVFQFNGRSSRTDFWIYAIFIFLIALGFWSVVMSMEISRASAEVQQYANAHPGEVTVTYGPRGVSYRFNGSAPGVGPDFGYLLTSISAITLVSLALIAAAVARRLHDTDRTGLWILLPLPFLFGGLWLMASFIGEFDSGAEPKIGVFALGFVNNLVYMATAAFVGFLLLRSGSAGVNRFGEREIEASLD